MVGTFATASLGIGRGAHDKNGKTWQSGRTRFTLILLVATLAAAASSVAGVADPVVVRGPYTQPLFRPLT